MFPIDGQTSQPRMLKLETLHFYIFYKGAKFGNNFGKSKMVLFLKNLNLAAKQCYQTGQFLWDKKLMENSTLFFQKSKKM